MDRFTDSSSTPLRVLALPPFKETLIESDALPWCADLLRRMMADWSEESLCAAWAGGIEFDLWLRIDESVDVPDRLTPSLQERQQFRALSELIGGWITRSPVDEYVYLPLSIWMCYFRDTQPSAACARLGPIQAQSMREYFDERAKALEGVELPSEEELYVMLQEMAAEESAKGEKPVPVSTSWQRISNAWHAYEAWKASGYASLPGHSKWSKI